MIELEFDGALHSMSGIAEALDAAGIDDHVPTHGGSAEHADAPADIAWAARSAAAVAAHAIAAPVPGSLCRPDPSGSNSMGALVAPEPMRSSRDRHSRARYNSDRAGAAAVPD